VVGTPGLPARGTRMLRANPNPFSQSTSLDFTLCSPSRVRLYIHDISGDRVALLTDRVFRAGAHSVAWDGRDEDGARIESGTYLARLEIEGTVEVRSITLIE
jgi:flagellar hook assembly protein FlgD